MTQKYLLRQNEKIALIMKRVLSVCLAALVFAAFSSVAMAVDCDHQYGPWVIVDPGEKGFLFNRPIEGRQEATCTVCGHVWSTVYDPGKVNLAENWTWTWKNTLVLLTFPISVPILFVIYLIRNR